MVLFDSAHLIKITGMQFYGCPALDIEVNSALTNLGLLKHYVTSIGSERLDHTVIGLRSTAVGALVTLARKMINLHYHIALHHLFDPKFAERYQTRINASTPKSPRA